MKSKIILGMLAGVCASAVSAQNQYGALNFLGNDINGTARFVGMGGAMSALGADLSTISTNPAGIALFRGNDFAATFGYNSNVAKSDWGNSVMKETRNKASFDQIGVVWSTKVGNKTDVRYVNFGFNYHKRANFNRQFAAKGNLNGNSLSGQMASMMANSGMYNVYGDFKKLLDSDNPYTDSYYFGTPYLVAMGARTGLLDVAYNKTPGGKEEITQFVGWNGKDGEYFSRESGSISEYDFNLSYNVRDRFYFGLTLGLYDIDYKRTSSYGEHLTSGGYVGSMTLNNTTSTEGMGVDLKFGAIIRPFEYSPFRFGIAIHTPTWYNMSDRYMAVLATDLSSEPQAYTENLMDYLPGGQYAFDYRFVTPWRFNLSMGTVVGGVMALDAEYEFEKYSAAKLLNTEGYDLNGTNAISETLKGVHTFRVGMETKVTSAFSVRAGYNFRSAPITDDAFKNIMVTDETRTDPEYMNLKSRQAVSVGLGYRGRVIYADIAYKYDFYKADFYPFDGGIDQNGNLFVPATKVTNERHQVLFTLGAHF